MAIPDYQTIMLPVLRFLSDNKEHSMREIINHISDVFNLSEEEKNKPLPSKHQPIIDNRVGWARTYLKKAGLLEDPRRGYARITSLGQESLSENLNRIDVKYLEKFPSFIEFRTIKRETTREGENDSREIEDITPNELIEKGYDSINASLAQELLEKLRDIDPYEFEKVVGVLLSSMGYGKTIITPKSGDGGIDGIVNQDKLGLDKIFFQAKRYAEGNIVSARDVRDFVGTLDLHGVNKGIFITTSRFPRDTIEILQKTPKSIILIDGAKLAQLMIEYGVGVSTREVYKIKEIDSDFFLED